MEKNEKFKKYKRFFGVLISVRLEEISESIGGVIGRHLFDHRVFGGL